MPGWVPSEQVKESRWATEERRVWAWVWEQ